MASKLLQGGADGSIVNKVRMQYYVWHARTLTYVRFALCNQVGKSALHWAVEKNLEGVVAVLLERGVDVDAADAVCSFMCCMFGVSRCVILIQSPSWVLSSALQCCFVYSFARSWV